MDCFKKIITNYDYADRLKPGGFVIDRKPALTQIDPELVGDYVIMVVRDPLLVYGGDPAEVLSQRLENRVLAGRSGMFTTYSGYYKGAHISIVSGGSGSGSYPAGAIVALNAYDMGVGKQFDKWTTSTAGVGL